MYLRYTDIFDITIVFTLLGNLLSDIHLKLTDALMQTQEFQQVADSLERWVNATQNAFKCLEPVAARVRLIEPQIEGFKVSFYIHCIFKGERFVPSNIMY